MFGPIGVHDVDVIPGTAAQPEHDTLAAILTGAAASRGVGRGAALLFVYSLGLGIPFLLLARGYASGGRAFAWLRRHGRAVEIVGGSVLLLMGVLMITGEWVRLFTPILRLFSKSGWPPV